MIKLFLLFLFMFIFSNQDTRYYYIIKIYHCNKNEQLPIIDDYLKNNYIPLLHKIGCSTIGVFKPIGNDTLLDKQIVMFIPFKNFKTYNLFQNLENNQEDNIKNSNLLYNQAAYNNPPYNRIEICLLRAFKNMPNFEIPQLTGSINEKIYEYRSYESATENLYKSKLNMFNEGREIEIFKRLNFNAIFYGDVLIGSRTPNLIYMTSFNNMQEREEHWKNFSNDPTWKNLLKKPMYNNNVSKADIVLMHATPYSDL